MKSISAYLDGEPGVTPSGTDSGTFLRLRVDYSGEPAALLAAIESSEGVSVHSMGRRLEIIKDVGTADEVSARHGVEEFIGTHGMAHSRLATESTVDVELSHPFWARPFLDVAITHNGQLTNYYKMRRLMTQRHLRFLTGNDSELIAVYIAEQLSQGRSLRDALLRSVDALDGVFTYLLSTESAIGCATDRLAIKPLLVTKIAGITALATEEQALRRVFDSELVTEYVREGTAVVWDVPAVTKMPVEA
ncbi:MAG: class II glutamine amidotransferase domain-containing protein [Acidimicrobiales bacterium]